jgi:hypothetical protein
LLQPLDLPFVFPTIEHKRLFVNRTIRLAELGVPHLRGTSYSEINTLAHSPDVKTVLRFLAMRRCVVIHTHMPHIVHLPHVLANVMRNLKG